MLGFAPPYLSHTNIPNFLLQQNNARQQGIHFSSKHGKKKNHITKTIAPLPGMMLWAHNLGPFRQEKALPKTSWVPEHWTQTPSCQQKLPKCSSVCSLRNEKKPKEEKAFNPKIILNFQYRAFEKNLKANRKTSRFFKMCVYSPFSFTLYKKSNPTPKWSFFLA